VAYYSAKDCTAFTYNSQDLKAFLIGDISFNEEALKTEWRPPGSAYKSRKLTGQYDLGPVEVPFIYDDTATGPAVKCAKGTSATLTFTMATGLSITGVFVVTSWKFGMPQEGDDTFTVTLENDGAVTWDLAA